LDQQYYYKGKKIDTVTWENSTLRAWLNDDFLNNAFNADEQSAIIKTTLSNDNNPYYSDKTTGGSSTDDNVFVLSIADCINENYGFYFAEHLSSDAGRNTNGHICDDPSREALLTSFVMKKGYWIRCGYNKYCGFWWLRNPGVSNIYAAHVGSGGYIFDMGLKTDDNRVLVRPAIYLDLSSDTWDYAGTVDSYNEEGEGIFPSKISVSSQVILKQGESVRLYPKVLPEKANYRKITYESSDNDVATVDEDGNVTAVKSGEAVITSYTVNKSHKSACNVIVKQPVTGVKFMPETVSGGLVNTIKPGESIKLNYAVLPDDADDKKVTFKSSDSEIASVNDEGVVTGHKEGEVTISVITHDGDFTDDFDITVLSDSDDNDPTKPDNPDSQEPSPTNPGSVSGNENDNNSIKGTKQISLSKHDNNGNNISMNITYTEAVTYNTKYHVSKEYDKPKKNNCLDVSVSINGSILELADVSKVKFKNNKKVIENKKPYFTVKIKPKKGITDEQRKLVKEMAKKLKNTRIEFKILPFDLSNAQVTVEFDKKKDTGRVDKKVFVIMDEKVIKLSKKDYDSKIENGNIIIAGKGNYTGVVTKNN